MDCRAGEDRGTAVSEGGLKRYEFKEARPEDKELLAKLDPNAAKNIGGAAAPADIGLDLHGKNIKAVYDAWDNDQDAETNGPEARKAVAIIRAMYESARKNGAPMDVK
jgi:UDP-N-acetyl-2-amino-2-deoxyglucuronate dehydrogenase